MSNQENDNTKTLRSAASYSDAETIDRWYTNYSQTMADRYAIYREHTYDSPVMDFDEWLHT